MTLQQLRYFLAMCDERSFTRAACRCGVSQPSLSNAIRALEPEFGGPLFIRKPPGRLTKLGKTIQPLIQSAILTLEFGGSSRSASPRGRPAHDGNRGAEAIGCEQPPRGTLGCRFV